MLLASKHTLGNRPLEHILPEHTTLLHIGEQRLDLLAETLGQAGQLAIGRGNPGFDLGADQACQHRRIAAAGHRDNQRRTIDDRRKNHAAQRRGIHHIDRDTTRLRLGGDSRIQRFVIGRRNDQADIRQVFVGVAAQQHLTTLLGGQLLQLLTHLGCHHTQAGTRIGEQTRLA